MARTRLRDNPASGKTKTVNFLAEVFIWMLLATITEVWVTATVERISLGDKYIMASVPFWSLQGHTTMWQWTVGLGMTVGLRLYFQWLDRMDDLHPIFKNIWFTAFIAMILIFVVELISGIFFNMYLGFHLWDYSQYVWNGIPLNLWGQITIVYAPFWYLAGLFVKPVYTSVHALAPYVGKSVQNLITDEIPEEFEQK